MSLDRHDAAKQAECPIGGRGSMKFFRAASFAFLRNIHEVA
jgi:hypothetical protein